MNTVHHQERKERDPSYQRLLPGFSSAFLLMKTLTSKISMNSIFVPSLRPSATQQSSWRMITRTVIPSVKQGSWHQAPQLENKQQQAPWPTRQTRRLELHQESVRCEFFKTGITDHLITYSRLGHLIHFRADLVEVKLRTNQNSLRKLDRITNFCVNSLCRLRSNTTRILKAL